mmetsp:Transcript_90145/g.257769  ORF Transcript_90145/g.257769 Transcript_90145/m.257769 type:complete len:200 (+) Transcript_90145:965-1564(+)
MRPSENRVFSTVMRHASHRNGSGSSSNHMIGVRLEDASSSSRYMSHSSCHIWPFLGKAAVLGMSPGHTASSFFLTSSILRPNGTDLCVDLTISTSPARGISSLKVFLACLAVSFTEVASTVTSTPSAGTSLRPGASSLWANLTKMCTSLRDWAHLKAGATTGRSDAAAVAAVASAAAVPCRCIRAKALRSARPRNGSER